MVHFEVYNCYNLLNLLLKQLLFKAITQYYILLVSNAVLIYSVHFTQVLTVWSQTAEGTAFKKAFPLLLFSSDVLCFLYTVP